MKVGRLQIGKLRIVDGGENDLAEICRKVQIPRTQIIQKGGEVNEAREVIKGEIKEGKENKDGNQGKEGNGTGGGIKEGEKEHLDPYSILEHCEWESGSLPTIVCRYQGRPRRINLAVCEWHCEERDQECVRLRCPRANRWGK